MENESWDTVKASVGLNTSLAASSSCVLILTLTSSVALGKAIFLNFPSVPSLWSCLLPSHRALRTLAPIQHSTYAHA